MYQHYGAHNSMSYMPSAQSEEQKQASANSDENNQEQPGQQAVAEKKPHQINISQILVDFKNTIASIGAPKDIEEKVNEYVAMVEVESNQELPRQATIVTHLKTASKLLDDYISDTLKKPSNVVQDWIDAFLLQEVDYKADSNKAAVPASKQIEAHIEETQPELKEQFQGNIPDSSATAQYNQYQQNINYHKPQAKNTSSAQKSIEKNELKEEKEEKPKKQAKFARRDGTIAQGKKIIGEKTDNGKVKKYTEKEAEEKEKELKENPQPKVEVKKTKPKKEIKTPESKYPSVSKDNTVQKFYEKSKEYLEKNDAKKALESFRKTLNYAKKAKDKKAQAHIIQDMGESYNKLNNLAKATKCFYKASKRTKNIDIKATSHHSLGSVYDEVGNFDLAMDHYFESLSLNGTGDNPIKQAKTLSNIGSMHADKYQSKDAIEFYKLSLTMAKQKSPDVSVMGEVLNNTADVFKSIGKPQKAMKYYQKAITCGQKINNKEANSKTYEKAGDLMLEMKKTSKAQNLYKKAIQEALINKDSDQVKILKEKMNLLQKAS